MKQDALIIVRGGGDLATGTIHRLWSAGFRVLVLEAQHPAAIRRQVALCEAVYEGETTVEGLRASASIRWNRLLRSGQRMPSRFLLIRPAGASGLQSRQPS